jgi:hypothetical protein
MAVDGNGNYVVRVTDSVLSTTILMDPLNAREAVAHASARYTILDPLIQPLPSSVPLNQFFPPYVGSFVIWPFLRSCPLAWGAVLFLWAARRLSRTPRQPLCWARLRALPVL